ncbi:down syndrome cell adhesion molecule-like protein Dscam2 [Trichonephila clavipes]|nr:down syndrome cell adhesion molecule-like protein Dscam2 [Trichonephila clavipes]
MNREEDMTATLVHSFFAPGISTFYDLVNRKDRIMISDVAPTLISVFPEHTAHIGDSISLKCISTGNPVPSVTWYLDDSVVSQSPRITAGDYVSEAGHVISFLNVSEIRVEDSGEYQCHVNNDVGSVYHAARLNVYGPPFVRRMQNITAISGEDLVMRCPYGGHPIKGIRWLKGWIPAYLYSLSKNPVLLVRLQNPQIIDNVIVIENFVFNQTRAAGALRESN